MSPFAAYGLVAQAIVFGAFVALLPFDTWRPRVALAATAMALMIGLAPTMHGLLGAPSVTLLLLSLMHVSDRLRQPLDQPTARLLLVAGALLYLPGLGLGPVDPYALGYQPWPWLLACAPVGVLLWRRGSMTALWLLAGDLAAYATGIFDNFWNVLLDPLLLMLALAVAVRRTPSLNAPGLR